jgi:hypothetical protein
MDARRRISGVRHADRTATMGDKSPKAKNKAKKQDTQNKSQKQADAKAKATPAGGQNAGKKKG